MSNITAGQRLYEHMRTWAYFAGVGELEWSRMGESWRSNWEEAAISAFTHPPVQWIKASERLPTAEDGDCEGQVWRVDAFFRGCGALLAKVGTFDAENTLYWTPTNLKKPEPPTV